MKALDRITLYVAALGLVLTAGAFVASARVGMGALAGTIVSVVDVAVIRWLAARMLAAGEKARAILSLLVVGKMTLLLGVCAALLFVAHVDAVGFAFGITALVLGVLVGGVHEHLTAPPSDASDPVATPPGGE
jgi:hypothetical protein